MAYVIEEFNHCARVADDWEDKAAAIVAKAIADIHAKVNAKFAEPKHGAVRGDGHIASAPGEAPAIDIGNLANSVEHHMTDKTTGEVNVGAEYGVYLELGTTRTAPRPFLAPSVEEEWNVFVRAMESLK